MELAGKIGNIHRPLQKEGYDVLIGFESEDGRRKKGSR